MFTWTNQAMTLSSVPMQPVCHLLRNFPMGPPRHGLEACQLFFSLFALSHFPFGVLESFVNLPHLDPGVAIAARMSVQQVRVEQQTA